MNKYLALVLAVLFVACSQTGTSSPTADALAEAVAAHVATTTGQPLCGDDVCPDPGAVQAPPVKAKLDSRTELQKAAAACRGSDGKWYCKGVPQPLMASGGNATAAQCGPACTVANWYLDPQNSVAGACASDANSCTSATCAGSGIGPCLNFAQIVLRLGSTMPVYPTGQSVQVNLLSSQSAGVDPIFFEPRMSGTSAAAGQAIFMAALVPTGASFLGGVATDAVRGAPGNLLTVATMPGGTAKNMLVVDSNAGRLSQSLIDSMSGATATMQQPQTTASVTSTAAVPAPVEDNGWTTGDTLTTYTLLSANLKRWQPTGGDMTAALQPSGGWVFYTNVVDPSGLVPGVSPYQMGGRATATVYVNCVINGRVSATTEGGRGNGFGLYEIGTSVVGLQTNFSPVEIFGGGWLNGLNFINATGEVTNDAILHGASTMETQGGFQFQNVYSDGTINVDNTMQATGFVWGSYAINLNPGATYANNTASTFALKALLTSGTVKINGVGTGYSFTAGTGAWGTGTGLTPGAIDGAPGNALFAQGGNGGYVCYPGST